MPKCSYSMTLLINVDLLTLVSLGHNSLGRSIFWMDTPFRKDWIKDSQIMIGLCNLLEQKFTTSHPTPQTIVHYGLSRTVWKSLASLNHLDLKRCAYLTEGAQMLWRRCGHPMRRPSLASSGQDDKKMWERTPRMEP